MTLVASKKKKASAARVAIMSEFAGTSDAVIHQIEAEAIKAIGNTTYYHE